MYTLIVMSKNKNSLIEFFNFINRQTNLNFSHFKNFVQKKTKKKIITILKSPHVNKKAQEQFEILLFSKQLNIITPQSLKFLVFLKKTKFHIFPDIKIKVQLFNTKTIKLLHNKIFNPDNFKNKTGISIYNNIKLQKIKEIKKESYKLVDNQNLNTKNFIKIFDIHGKYDKLVWIAQ